MTEQQFETIRRALEACRYELTTLIPRLPSTFRKNAEACVKLADDAFVEMAKIARDPE